MKELHTKKSCSMQDFDRWAHAVIDVVFLRAIVGTEEDKSKALELVKFLKDLVR